MFSKYILCPEESETGTCALRTKCPYLHKDTISKPTPSQSLVMENSFNHHTTSYTPSSTFIPSYQPHSQQLIEEYDPCNPTGNPSLGVSYATIPDPIPEDKPKPVLHTIRTKPDQYILPNDRVPKLKLQSRSSKPIPRPVTIKKKSVDRASLMNSLVNVNRINKTIKKPTPKRITKTTPPESLKKDILDQIPKSERPEIAWLPKAHLTTAQRRPMMEHFLRLFMENLGEGETYKDAIKKAVDVEHDLCIMCSTYTGYKGESGRKYMDLRTQFVASKEKH